MPHQGEVKGEPSTKAHPQPLGCRRSVPRRDTPTCRSSPTHPHPRLPSLTQALLRTATRRTHAVMNFIIRQRDVVLVHRVPLLYPDLLGPRAWRR